MIGLEIATERDLVPARTLDTARSDLRRTGLGRHPQARRVAEKCAGRTLGTVRLQTFVHLAQRRPRGDRRGDGTAFETLLDPIAAAQAAHEHRRDHLPVVGFGVVFGFGVGFVVCVGVGFFVGVGFGVLVGFGVGVLVGLGVGVLVGFGVGVKEGLAVEVMVG